ncbi:Bacillibactin transport regulator [Hartmannibacter diazotrophicus]|uniref:Bacillibactin transport regulator n=1 Tax=Hartmannibacter diazotrophicus TaxID=1482074 RepID=A0A2C9DB56_9HYPH|nr:Bacillibactin transport regulator [Hartmannibacter diazotrophicus]
MLALPVPLIVAIVLAFLVIRILVVKDRPWLLAVLIGVCGLQSLIVALNQYYGFGGLGRVQPVTATVIPPLAWVIFQVTAVRPFSRSLDVPHAAVPLFAAFCVVFAPMAVDVVVCGVFLIYGGLMLNGLRAGPDGLPRMRLEAGERPELVWRVIALALILSAVNDGLIALVLAQGMDWLKPLIVGGFSSLALLAIGILGLSQSLAQEPDDAARQREADEDPGVVEEHAALMSRLRHLLNEEPLYLDPNLTLARLARRLGVPAKHLSTAINRGSGQNVSRFINDFRIRHACALLARGDSVTSAMLESGFNTKSNFNREFLRVSGVAPSAWLAQQVDAEPAGEAAPAHPSESRAS